MLSDIHIRLQDTEWPRLKIVISVEGQPSRTVVADWDKFATTAEPAVNNVIKAEVDRMIRRRQGK